MLITRKPEGTRITGLILALVLLSGAGRAEIANVVVTSAASFEEGMPWGGSTASVFCTGLKGISGVISADRYPLPLELAGVRVTVGRTRAPLFAVADFGAYQQINLQVPWEEEISTSIVIEQGGELRSVLTPHILLAGQFFRLPDGNGAFQHGADYASVGAGNPARPGDVVVGYFTGLRIRPVPKIPTGQPSPVGQPSWEKSLLRKVNGDTRPVWEIQVGDDNRKVVAPSYLGLAPGLVGVYQVNFMVPEGLAPGSQPVRLVQWKCAMLFGYCAAFIPDSFSLPVSMAVR